MIKKIILEGEKSRGKLISGALKVCRMLGSTLGPRGRNVIIQKAYSAPEITNDGGTIARHIVLEDPTEDLGAQTIVEATMKTNDRGGDGRTTTALLAGVIIETASKKIKDQDNSGGLNGEAATDVIGMSREILDGKDVVIEKLKSASRLLKKGELKNVVATSIGKIYPEHVDVIADMVEKVGKNGYIAVEDNWGTKYGIESNVIEGMRFLGSYASPVMISNDKKEAVAEDIHFLITNHRIENTLVLSPLIEKMREKNIKKLVVVSEGFEKETIFQVASAYVRHANLLAEGKTNDFFKIVLVKAPSLTTEQFEDVAVFVGAKFFNKNLADNSLGEASIEHLGFAKKVIVDEDDTNITGGKGNVKDRLKLLNAELDIEKDSAFKEQLKRRIGAMASGFGIIRVGASTETERVYIKKKIHDSVNAAKAALEEGVLPGGGIALRDIGENLGKDHILYEALIAPYKTIQKSLGGNGKVASTVLDAHKVTRLAVENACSVAAHLITCDGSIADRRRTLMDDLESALAPKDNDDFRDDENQELKYRT